MASVREKSARSSDDGSAGGSATSGRPAAPAAQSLPSLWSLIADYRDAPPPEKSQPEPPAAVTQLKAELSQAPQPPIQPPDDFQRISGLDARHAVWLGELGFRWYHEIAAWTAADVATVRSVLRLDGEIGRFGWIEQAAMLAAGKQTDFSRRRSLGLPPDLHQATEPARSVVKSVPAVEPVRRTDQPVVAVFSTFDAELPSPVAPPISPAVVIEKPPEPQIGPKQQVSQHAVDVLPRSRSRVAEIDSTVEGIVTAVAALTTGRAWAAHLVARDLAARASVIEIEVPKASLPVPVPEVRMPPPALATSTAKPSVKIVPIPAGLLQPAPATATEPVLPRVRLVIDGEPIARYADDHAGPVTGIEIDPDWTPASRKKLSPSAIGSAISAVTARAGGEKFVPFVEPAPPVAARPAAALSVNGHRATVIASTVEEATVSIISGGAYNAARAVAAAAAMVSIEGLFPASLSPKVEISEAQNARIRRFLNALTGEKF